MSQLRSLIPSDLLQNRVKELGKEIRSHHGAGALTCICVLRGALFFAADLVRHIGGDVRLEFLHINNQSDSLEIDISYLSGEIEGHDCILIEDIVETGLTLQTVHEYLLNQKPRSLHSVSLLDKPSTRNHNIKIDFIGFSIPDEFVVGYGLDLHGRLRALNYIATYIP
jgi:hypoxanthine phosphoribosyltransferase